MSIATQKQGMLDAVTQLRLAEQALIVASRTMTDPAQLIQVNTEYSHLDSYVSQLLQTQAIADDATFTAATASLKAQATNLQTQEAGITTTIKDVATAAQIVSYITQAINIIAAL